jgi:hypothetical protein
VAVVLPHHRGDEDRQRSVPGGAAMNLQESYWLAGILLGVVANIIAIATFVRNRPDKMKAAIQESVEPLNKRLTHIETTMKLYGNDLSAQGKELAKISSDMAHAPNGKDLDRINDRITELVEKTSYADGLMKTQGQLMDRIQQLLMKPARR